MSALVLYAAPTAEPLTVAEVLRHCRVDASNQEIPPGIISVALGVGAGIVTTGQHRYLATFVTSDGETDAGLISAPITVVDTPVALSNIPVGGAVVTARKLYRTAAGGTVFYLLAIIANNTATTYSDNIADGSLGAQAPTTNTTTDPMFMSFIKAARVSAEGYTRRALMTQTWDLVLDCFPGWEIYIPKPTLQSIVSITYLDTNGTSQVLSADQYVVDTQSTPGRIIPAYGLIWPSTRGQINSVTIRFIAGYGAASAVPDGIKSWMKIRIKHLYDNPDIVLIGTRTQISEFPRSVVDGLLDEYAVQDFNWER